MPARPVAPTVSAQAEAIGDRRRLYPPGHAELGEDVGDVDAGCLAADEQLTGDLGVAAAASQEPKDFALPRREPQSGDGIVRAAVYRCDSVNRSGTDSCGRAQAGP